jgi:hypothetical protein
MSSLGGPTTYGWDVVYVARASVVNAGLVVAAAQTFDEVVTQGSVSAEVRGSLDGWQIAAGGSGALVNLTVACPTLSLTNEQKTVHFTGGHFLVQAGLELRAADPPKRPGQCDLAVASGRGAVTVLGATFAEASFASFEVYAKAACQAWLDAQASLPCVLAGVELAAAGVVGPAAALAPVSATYAYADAPDGGGVLGVLWSIDGHGSGPGQLLQEVSPDALGSADCAVLVSAATLQRLVSGASGAVTLPGAATSLRLPDQASVFPVAVERAHP